MIKIYIVEDHEMYLEGLSLLLSREPDLEVSGTSKDGLSFLEKLPGLDKDLLLLDLHLPDVEPEEFIQRVRAVKPDNKIILLTLMRGTRYIHKLLKYNIQGYILKSAPIEQLLIAIRTVHNDGTYFSDDVDIRIKEDDIRNTVIIEGKRVDEILTKRELEIMKLVCKEYSNAEIAEKLFLSIGTVETHRKRIISKLGVNNTVGLVKFALKNGLVE
jgi:DNA-binding NarL/FixJ family response regulator